MSSFVKTCVSQTLLLTALSVPIVLAGGCEQQSDPPVEPRAVVGLAGAGASPDTGAPPPAGTAPAATEVADSRISGSDGAITARVKTALMADEQVKGLRIDVDTKDATVTLKGALDNDEQVARAVDVARGVEGVRDVINRLSVKGEDKAAQTDKG